MGEQRRPRVSVARRAARRAAQWAARRARALLGRPTPAPPPAPKSKRVWSIGIYTGASPLDLAPDPRIPNPVLTRDHVTDVPASFVADPFLARDGDRWHLFFELLNRRNG